MQTLDKFLNKIESYRKQKKYTSFCFPSEIAKIQENSLLFYYGNIHSQRGQDGILAEIFRRLKITSGVFVEFGAWDGKYLCNSRWLYEKGWSGVFIEGVEKRFRALRDDYSDDLKITALNAFVGAPAYGVVGQRLSELLKGAGCDTESIDFLSIDVDGCDLELLRDSQISPKVVLLEGGFNFAPYINGPASPAAWKAGLQHPLGHIETIAAELGFTLVCFYQDSYLVRSDLAGPFLDIAQGAVSLYCDAFNFMPQDFRKQLIDLRRRNALIRKFEEDIFGMFCESPIDSRYVAARQKA